MFEISKGKSNAIDYENAIFVIKSISDDASRPFMCVVHIEESETGSRLICTDGRRLHYADITIEIPEGDYTPVITRGSIFLKGPIQVGSFPNWKRVIPENRLDHGSLNLEKATIGKNSSHCANFSRVYAELIKKTGEVINIKYLDDLSKREWQVLSAEERNKPILFRRSTDGKESVAVIMPMSVVV